MFHLSTTFKEISIERNLGDKLINSLRLVETEFD